MRIHDLNHSRIQVTSTHICLVHLESKSLKTYLTIASLSAQLKSIGKFVNFWCIWTFVKFWCMARFFEILNLEHCSRILLPILKKAGVWTSKAGVVVIIFLIFWGLWIFIAEEQICPAIWVKIQVLQWLGKGVGWFYYDNYHVHKLYLTEVGFSCVHYTSFHGPLWSISKVHFARLHVVQP